MFRKLRGAVVGLAMMGRIFRSLAAGALLTLGGLTSVGATPLGTGSWTQVGYMSAGGGMFKGDCDLASGCNSSDVSGDFWSAFQTFSGQEILFITGDRQIWAAASYASVAAIVAASAGVLDPNITWSDAGLDGSSLGSGVVREHFVQNPLV